MGRSTCPETPKHPPRQKKTNKQTNKGDDPGKDFYLEEEFIQEEEGWGHVQLGLIFIDGRQFTGILARRNPSSF